MATVSLTPALRAEYENLFNTCVIRPERAAAVERLIDTLVANRARYQAVSSALRIPWHFIAVIHNMESSQSFKGHCTMAIRCERAPCRCRPVGRRRVHRPSPGSRARRMR